MISTPIDAFIFLLIVSAILFISAVVAKSPILGAFTGLLMILTGIYGLTNNISPITAPLSTGISMAVVGLGLYLFLLAVEAGLSEE